MRCEGDVLSFGPWSNNAELIADVQRLGYLDGEVLDLTYGHGKFWDLWRPDVLVANDLHPEKGDTTVDVRDLWPPPEWHGQFGAVVYDPPYRMSGKRDLGQFDERYGLSIKDSEIPDLIERGVVFASVCVATGGRILVKCQDQQWSGKLFEQTAVIREAGRAVGLRVVDRFHFPIQSRPQPPGRKQRSARNNYSTLMVLGR